MPAADGILPLIPLDRASRRPLHLQIADAIRAAVSRGDLRAGQRIPSSRALAVILGLSRMPVLTAYAQLIAEGFLETGAGAGTHIARALAAPRPALRPAAPAPPPAAVRRPRPLARRTALLPAFQPSPWMGQWGAFGVHQPALEVFPFATWARLLARHARNPGAQQVRRIPPPGIEPLRAAICDYLRTARAVRCDPGQILVVSGSQQAVDLCARVLCDPGSPVWFEDPGYWLARRAFVGAGARIVPVPVDDEGLDVAAGVRLCRRARCAYVTPSHQYPLGSTMSASRRLQLLRWAERNGAWIIEDDYDGEYRFSSKPVQSLQGLDTQQRVLYVGTFSKVMFPTLRLGYIVLPPDLVGHFIASRVVADVGPSYIGQAVLADFIAEGHFARHIHRTRRLYADRQVALVQALRRNFDDDWQIHGEGAGMHIAFAARRRVSDVDLAHHAAAERLWLWPLSPAYAARPRLTGFILGCGSTTAAAMPAAVARLVSALGR